MAQAHAGQGQCRYRRGGIVLPASDHRSTDARKRRRHRPQEDRAQGARVLMRALGLAVAMVLALAVPAFAASPSAAQKAEFYKVCMGIANDEALCTCKADAAMTLIDERFMGVVIKSMQGGSPAEGDYVAYNAYVAKSNQI